MNQTGMDISTVERDTGLGKDTLRVWERRYGFPKPARDQNGDRVYSSAQVARLRLMKRLLDHGFRPGKLCTASEQDLAQLLASTLARATANPEPGEDLVRQAVALIKANDSAGLRQALNQSLMRLGLQSFVLDIVAPLTHAVGDAWMNGELAVFEEHLFSEQMKSLLRQAIGNLPQEGGRPRILLTTLPEEQHVLGLLMAEALLVLDGATCISLGTQTPLLDIQMATRAHEADIVAVSFSAAFPARQVASTVKQLRQLLPTTVALWIGGAGVQRVSRLASSVVALPGGLRAALEALNDWRQQAAGDAA